jgi:hypothetical protein
MDLLSKLVGSLVFQPSGVNAAAPPPRKTWPVGCEPVRIAGSFNPSYANTYNQEYINIFMIQCILHVQCMGRHVIVRNFRALWHRESLILFVSWGWNCHGRIMHLYWIGIQHQRQKKGSSQMHMRVADGPNLRYDGKTTSVTIIWYHHYLRYRFFILDTVRHWNTRPCHVSL